MEDTFNGLEKLNKHLKTFTKDSMADSIAEIELCSSQIGKLYVSCCTKKRRTTLPTNLQVVERSSY